MSTDWPEGVDRIILDEVDSTMAEARRRANDLRGPTWILAKRQTSAHGRRGRVWEHPKGNFAATLLMRPEGELDQAALRSFVAAVALFQTLEASTGANRLSLKWPNDVLFDGGKVAGILLESSGQGERLDWLAIGVGINLISAPDGLSEVGAMPAVSVRDAAGHAPSLDAVLTRLAARFADLEKQFQTFGFAPIRRLWLSRAARLGQVITARTTRAEITGTFKDVDDTGQLVLHTAKGQVRVAAADVYF